MKIEKFNEGVKKEYFICMTISQNTNEIQTFGIFETEKDMDNWLINSANEYLPRTSAKVGENGIEEDQNGKQFQKEYLQQSFNIEKNVTPNDIYPYVLKEINDKFELNPKIEKEYIDYMYMVKGEKYNL